MTRKGSPRAADDLLRKAMKLDDPEIEEIVRKLTELTDLPLGDVTGAASAENVALACSMYEARRLRAGFLSDSILGEPAWDMLLALFCFTARGEALSVSALCHASNAPATTALRRVQILEQKNLIARRRDRFDGRRIYLTLTADGAKLMTNYLTAVQERIDTKV